MAHRHYGLREKKPPATDGATASDAWRTRRAHSHSWTRRPWIDAAQQARLPRRSGSCMERFDATENDAAVASAQLKPQYVVSPDPCLPNKRLRPVWRQAYLVSEAAD